jgi:hypothetical protein
VVHLNRMIGVSTPLFFVEPHSGVPRRFFLFFFLQPTRPADGLVFLSRVEFVAL